MMLMNSETQNSILSKVNILVVKQTLLTLIVNGKAAIVDKIGKHDFAYCSSCAELCRPRWLLLNFLVQGFKVIF